MKVARHLLEYGLHLLVLTRQLSNEEICYHKIPVCSCKDNAKLSAGRAIVIALVYRNRGWSVDNLAL